MLWALQSRIPQPLSLPQQDLSTGAPNLSRVQGGLYVGRSLINLSQPRMNSGEPGPPPSLPGLSQGSAMALQLGGLSVGPSEHLEEAHPRHVPAWDGFPAPTRQFTDSRIRGRGETRPHRKLQCQSLLCPPPKRTSLGWPLATSTPTAPIFNPWVGLGGGRACVSIFPSSPNFNLVWPLRSILA